MPRPSRRLLAVAVLSLLALPACSVDPTYLSALLADPMAEYQAEGINLFDAFESNEHSGFLGGKPGHAEVGRHYRIENQSEVRNHLEEAVEYAKSQGWRIQKESDREYRGTRELEPGTGRIHLSTPVEDILNDPNGPRMLRIYLDFGPVRFDDDIP